MAVWSPRLLKPFVFVMQAYKYIKHIHTECYKFASRIIAIGLRTHFAKNTRRFMTILIYFFSHIYLDLKYCFDRYIMRTNIVMNLFVSNLSSRWIQLSHSLSTTLELSSFLALLGPAENKVNKRQANNIS